MRHGFSSGFTLVEVMVSLTIFSLVMAGIFVGITGFEKSMKFETAMENVQGSATFLLDRLGRDLSHILLFRQNLEEFSLINLHEKKSQGNNGVQPNKYKQNEQQFWFIIFSYNHTFPQ